MRKISHEQRVMRQRIVSDLAAISIDQKRDLREGVEGDTDRQQDVHRNRRREYRVEIGDQKARIFEDAERYEVAGHTDRQHGKTSARAKAPRNQQPADEIIERDRRQQQHHERPIAERIENQRGQREPYDRRLRTNSTSGEIAEENGRQKDKNEGVRVEKHRFPCGKAEPNHTTL